MKSYREIYNKLKNSSWFKSVYSNKSVGDTIIVENDETMKKEKSNKASKYKNPIIDNRIVSNITFAIRFLAYLQDDYPEIGGAHPMIEEEYEYMCSVACNLIKYQFETCPEDEMWYFNNLVKDVKTFDELIEKHFKPDFVRYLKAIKVIKK